MDSKISAATLKDVAQKAGVSLSTASRVLSDADYPVSRALRARVINASKELNYIPNALGKMLKNNLSDAIGIIVPTLQNPFYNQVIFGIEAVATKSGRELRLLSSHRSVEQERKHILSLLHSHIMSLIILSIDSSSDVLEQYISYGGKVALLEANFEMENVITAETNYFVAGELATRHLLDLGHRHIAFLTSPLTKPFRRSTLNGTLKTMEKSGLRLQEEDIFIAEAEQESETGMYEFETGRLLAERVLASPKKYTALITINDIMAFGVIQTLMQHGISVPDDISVIAFDNIIYSEMISPPLTTVNLPSSTMGSAACRMLISEIEFGKSNMQSMTFRFPCTLITRQSTAAPRQL